jgi:hypothetical protein
MDKTKLKRKIKSFATNCAFAVITLMLALIYVMIMWPGEDMIWFLIGDIICFAGDVLFAFDDWKEIKKMLEESE